MSASEYGSVTMFVTTAPSTARRRRPRTGSCRRSSRGRPVTDQTPSPSRRIGTGVRRSWRRRVADEQVDVLGRRRPQRQLAACRRCHVTPSVASDGVAVDVVEDAGDLHAGRVDQPAEVVVGGDGELPGEQLVHAAAGVVARQPQRVVRGQVRPLLAHVGRQPVRVERQRERRAAEDRLLVDGQPAGRGGVQPEAPPGRPPAGRSQANRSRSSQCAFGWSRSGNGPAASSCTVSTCVAST